jgi:hypothetical protein
MSRHAPEIRFAIPIVGGVICRQSGGNIPPPKGWKTDKKSQE